MRDLILEPHDLRLMDGLGLNPRKRFSGLVRGERTTQKKGVSIEFSDYRDYAEGDDLRHLDWNILARLGQAVTKTYRDEEDLAVHLLLDASASMDFGEPSKWSTACSLGAALSLAALTTGDALYARTLGHKAAPISALRGRTGYARFANWVSGVEPNGTNPLEAELRAFAASGARIGLVILLTDALSPTASQALRILAARGHEVWLLQILSDTEIDPDLEGDLRLIDAEDTTTAEVTINSFALTEYKTNLKRHNQGLADEALRSGGRYALVEAGTPLNRVVRDVWRREKWVE